MAQSLKAENERKRRIWKKRLKDWHASGRAQEDYCRERSISRYIPKGLLTVWKSLVSGWLILPSGITRSIATVK